MILSNRRSFGSTVLALLALVCQVALAAAGPIADAREPNSVVVHFDGPRQHHASHDEGNCALCIAIHATSVPGANAPLIPVARVGRIASAPEPAAIYATSTPSLQTARAPPVSA